MNTEEYRRYEEQRYREWAADYSLSELQAGLQESKERLAELDAQGDAACSAYDLRYGYDAVFNKKLVGNHVRWYERMIAAHPDSQQYALF